ncbi:hypothetical protein G4228_004119 [Cervus hanglu yarkandensis]|nr:hypothetical protein G4228_004119 [Cervus hanglu yarkandensis]
MDRPERPRLSSLSDFRFGAVATETIEDTLLHLAQQNEQAVQEAAGRMGSFRETRIVEFVFLLSEQWCLEKSVSYQAVEILERFMVKQAENICRQATIQLRGKTEPQNWRALKEQLFNKFILRLVSCVQLASKLSFHYKVMGHLQSITGIALESIAEFSYAILTHSVGASTPGQQQPVPPHLVARPPRAAASSNT